MADNHRDAWQRVMRQLVAVVHNSSNCSFLAKLPCEVRQLIYAHSLGLSAVIDVDHIHSRNSIIPVVSRLCYREWNIEFFKTHTFFTRLYRKIFGIGGQEGGRGEVEREIRIPRFFLRTSEKNLAALRRVYAYLEDMTVLLEIRMLHADRAAIDQGLQPRDFAIKTTILGRDQRDPKVILAYKKMRQWEIRFKERHAAHTLFTTRAHWWELGSIIADAVWTLHI